MKTGGQSVFKIDRISKHTCSLICNTKACGHRLTIEHDIPTVASGKYRGRCIAPTIGKEEMMNRSNWLKVDGILCFEMLQEFFHFWQVRLKIFKNETSYRKF